VGFGGAPYGLSPYGSVDTRRPRIDYAVSLDGFRIEVFFSESMADNAALVNASNYAVTPLIGAAATTVLSVDKSTPGVLAGYLSVILHHTGTTLGGTYSIGATTIEDVAGNEIEALTVSLFTLGEPPPLTITPISSTEVELDWDFDMLSVAGGSTIDQLSSYELNYAPGPVTTSIVGVTFPYSGDNSKVLLELEDQTSILYTVIISPATAFIYDASVLPDADPGFTGTELNPANGTSVITALPALSLSRSISTSYGWQFEDTSGKLVTSTTFRVDLEFDSSSTVFNPPLSGSSVIGVLTVEDAAPASGVQVKMALESNSGVEQIHITSGTYDTTISAAWNTGGPHTITVIRNIKAGIYTFLFDGEVLTSALIATLTAAASEIGGPGASWVHPSEAYTIAGFLVLGLDITASSTVYSDAWNFLHNDATAFTGIASSLTTQKYIWTQKGPLTKDWGDATPATKNDVVVTVNGTEVDVADVNPYIGRIELEIPIPTSDPPPTVLVDYYWQASPIMLWAGLNTEGLVLNKWDRNGRLPTGPRFPMAVVLGPAIADPEPLYIGHRYLGFEREYSALLNSYTTLRLNQSPQRTSVPGFTVPTDGVSVAYEGTQVPTASSPIWRVLTIAGTITDASSEAAWPSVDAAVEVLSTTKLRTETPEFPVALAVGDTVSFSSGPYAGTYTITALTEGNGLSNLTISPAMPQGAIDQGQVNINEGTYTLTDAAASSFDPNDPQAVVYYREEDLSFPASLNVVGRFAISDDSQLDPDGVFTGVGFGVHDNKRLYLCGALKVNGLDHVGLLLDAERPHEVGSWSIGPNTVGTIGDSRTITVTTSEAPVDVASGDQFQILTGNQTGVFTIDTVVHQTDGTSTITIEGTFPAEHDLYGNKYPTLYFETPWVDDPTTTGPTAIENQSSYRLVVDLDAGEAQLIISGGVSGTVATVSGSSSFPQPAHTSLLLSTAYEGQVFWGSLSRKATSSSTWSFFRYGVVPDQTAVRGNLVTVATEMTVVPEDDTGNEWFTTQSFGFAEIDSSEDALLLKSTSAHETLDFTYGKSRIEPFLTPEANFDLRSEFVVESGNLGSGDAQIVINDQKREVRLGTILYVENAFGATGEVRVEIGSPETGLAQSGGATTITLAANSSPVDEHYTDWDIYLTGGTGSGQVRKILSYDGGTKTATVAAWGVIPDLTTQYSLYEDRLVPGDRVLIGIGRRPLTASLSPAVPGSDDFQIDLTSASTTAANIASAINDPLNSFTDLVTASSALHVVTLEAVEYGEAGNNIALELDLTYDGLSISGSHLTGGRPYRELLSDIPTASFSGLLDPEDQGFELEDAQGTYSYEHKEGVFETAVSAGTVPSETGSLLYQSSLNTEVGDLYWTDTGNRIAEARFAVTDYTADSSDFLGLFLFVLTGSRFLTMGLVGGSSPQVRMYDYGSSAVIQDYSFDWDDGEPHTYRFVASQTGDTLSVFADDTLLTPTLTLSSLDATSDNAITFGVYQTELDQEATVEWHSVSFVVQPPAGASRTLGIWLGGDKDDIDNWELPRTDSSTAHNSEETGPVIQGMDWTSNMEIRLYRDPTWGVTLYRPDIALPPYFVAESTTPGTGFAIDTTEPSAGWINVEYRNLPKEPSVFGFASFGALDSRSVTQQRWEYVRYRLHKHPTEDFKAPQGMVLNRYNVINSGELIKDVTPELVAVQTLNQYQVSILPTHLFADRIFKVIDGSTIYTPEMFRFDPLPPLDTDFSALETTLGTTLDRRAQTITLLPDSEGEIRSFSASGAAVTVVFAPGKPVSNTYLCSQPLLDGVTNLNEGTPPFIKSQDEKAHQIVVYGDETDYRELAADTPADVLTDPFRVLAFEEATGSYYEGLEFCEVTDGGQTGLISSICEGTLGQGASGWSSEGGDIIYSPTGGGASLGGVGASGGLFDTGTTTGEPLGGFLLTFGPYYEQGVGTPQSSLGGIPGTVAFTASGGGYEGPAINLVGSQIAVLEPLLKPGAQGGSVEVILKDTTFLTVTRYVFNG